MPTGTSIDVPPPGVPDAAALLRLMQLVSPALPVGAYAYSHGLEWAVEAGWIGGEADAEAWIRGLLQGPWTRLDIPVLGRLMEARAGGDDAALERWADLLYSCRESAELRAEDRSMGQALGRLLADLGVAGAERWATAPRSTFPAAWACAAVYWGIAPAPAACGLLWTHAEHQVAAAVKLVPLGQTAGQRILARLADAIPSAAAAGLALDEADIGAGAPGLALASALHETQYTRLFRS